ASAHRHQFAARRALDRPSHEDRAIRPLPGGLRAQRRLARPGDRRTLTRGCIRVRDRGVPHRHALHDSGDPAHRRLYRQCRRAVARAGHEQLSAVPGAILRYAAGGRRGRHAIRTQRGPRPAMDQARHARPRAPHRRDRKGAGHRQHRLPSRSPPGDDQHTRRQGARRRQLDPRPGLPRPRRRKPGGRRLGLDLRSDPPGRAPRDRQGTGRRPRPRSPHLADAQKYVCPIEGLQTYPRARDEHGPAQDRAPRPVPGRRQVADEGVRSPVPDRRDRGRDRCSFRRGLACARVELSTLATFEASTGSRELQTHERLVDGDPADRYRPADHLPEAALMNEMTTITTAKDWASDQEVRWCPGCGDYAVLKAVQRTMPDLGVAREKTVFISGIGCSSRFPYYMACYGFHTIHGRAAAIATGAKLANPELDVWIITGDGDALSIGGNHTMHVLRRNLDCQILLFNNEIYGLTKGQYSPTSRVGTRSPSTPFGSVDRPVTPCAFALGSGARFIARGIDVHKNLPDVLKAAHAHRGASFVEIFQNCIVYNDDVFASFTEKQAADEKQLWLKPGEKMVFAGGTKGLALDTENLRLK